MIAAGCDVGSLTAKTVVLKDGKFLGSEIIRVKPTALKSAETVMNKLLSQLELTMDDIDITCSTGYGRLEIPFANMNMSEISCHGMGAFWTDNNIRTIIDIGGQDCKVISIDENGLIKDFIMNEKCAAGTGKSLEILSKTIGVELEELGALSIKSKKPLDITNKCSIFMELEVLDAIYKKKKMKHIAAGLSDAVAKRVVSMVSTLEIIDEIAITGGVSKNAGVVKQLEKRMETKFTTLSIDSQVMGALGAAIFAERSNPSIKEVD